jgi:hypothetical protein
MVEPYYMASTVKEVAVGGTVLEMNGNKVDIPVGAGLKGSTDIEIAEDGTISIKSISWDKLSQGEGTLVMDGGGAGVASV